MTRYTALLSRYNRKNMSAIIFVSWSRTSICTVIAVCASASVVFAQTPTPTAPVAPAPSSQGARVEVPDGSPQLAFEKVVSHASVTAHATSGSGVIVDEERVQGRLSAAHISVAGSRGYTVIDPNVGRTNRDATNGSKRVTASLWELLRF